MKIDLSEYLEKFEKELTSYGDYLDKILDSGESKTKFGYLVSMVIVHVKIMKLNGFHHGYVFNQEYGNIGSEGQFQDYSKDYESLYNVLATTASEQDRDVIKRIIYTMSDIVYRVQESENQLLKVYSEQEKNAYLNEIEQQLNMPSSCLEKSQKLWYQERKEYASHAYERSILEIVDTLQDYLKYYMQYWRICFPENKLDIAGYIKQPVIFTEEQVELLWNAGIFKLLFKNPDLEKIKSLLLYTDYITTLELLSRNRYYHLLRVFREMSIDNDPEGKDSDWYKKAVDPLLKAFNITYELFTDHMSDTVSRVRGKKGNKSENASAKDCEFIKILDSLMKKMKNS